MEEFWFTFIFEVSCDSWSDLIFMVWVIISFPTSWTLILSLAHKWLIKGQAELESLVIKNWGDTTQLLCSEVKSSSWQGANFQSEIFFFNFKSIISYSMLYYPNNPSLKHYFLNFFSSRYRGPKYHLLKEDPFGSGRYLCSAFPP